MSREASVVTGWIAGTSSENGARIEKSARELGTARRLEAAARGDEGSRPAARRVSAQLRSLLEASSAATL